jgi:phage baseplate assembly protein W
LARTTYTYNPFDLIPDKAIGIKLPFSGKKQLFDLSYTTEEQSISNLKNLLLTRKGERLMHPNFGTAIYNSLFENIDDQFFMDIEQSLTEDINFWLPYIIIDSIQAVELDPGEARDYQNGFKVLIKFRATENGANRTIILAFGDSQATVIQA